MSSSSKVTMLSSGAILTRLANKVFSFLGTNFAQQSKYHPAAYKWDSENLVVCAVVYM
jgi:nitroimidazol reductase NimA-like FMN-containing flavoprotein (pyridoxamine 5'-phosphate oxidase superfamily)